MRRPLNGADGRYCLVDMNGSAFSLYARKLADGGEGRATQ
jgi:hypothetical protein